MLGIEKRNVIWLAALSIIMLLVVISPNIAGGLQALLLAFFLLALVGTALDSNVRERLLQAITRQVNLPGRSRVSPQAREAADKARARGSYYASAVEMIDVGLIASQSGSEGMVMRRTRSISKDDDGVRPFITLQVPGAEADRDANVRFELIDQNGNERYIHQMQVFLREGEVNVLADHHLPMMGNDEIAGMGDWDLRVYVDDTLIGVHALQLVPSSEERRDRVRSGGRHYAMQDEEPARRTTRDDGSKPMSLEDLLRGQDEAEQRRR